MAVRFSITAGESSERPRLVCTTTPVALTVRFNFGAMILAARFLTSATRVLPEKRLLSKGTSAFSTRSLKLSMAVRMAGIKPIWDIRQIAWPLNRTR
jgi:hypothetical protein